MQRDVQFFAAGALTALAGVLIGSALKAPAAILIAGKLSQGPSGLLEAYADESPGFDTLSVTDEQLDGLDEGSCAVCGLASPRGSGLRTWLMLSKGDGKSAPLLFCCTEHAEVHFAERTGQE